MKNALETKPFLTYEADIFYHLGLSYCRLQKFEKSIFPYSRCIEKIPSDLRYIHERAKAYQMIDLHEKAVADFDVVIRKNPTNAHAYFRRAFSLKSLKVRYTCYLQQVQFCDPLIFCTEVRRVCGRLREGEVFGADEPSAGRQLQKASKRNMHRPVRARRRERI